MVEMTRDLQAQLRRRIDFLHLPVPKDRTDGAYFAPLGDLSPPAETALYLGLIHHPDVAGIARALPLRTRCCRASALPPSAAGPHRFGAPAGTAGRASECMTAPRVNELTTG